MKNYTANIYATDSRKINEFNSFELKSFAGIGQSQIDNKIIISENFAKKHSLKLNDEVYLKIFNSNKRYEVAGIAKNTGLFFNHDVLANDRTVYEFFWQELGYYFVSTPIYNRIYVKLFDKSTLDEKINIFKASEDFKDKEIMLSDRGSDTMLLNAQGKLLIIIAFLIGFLSIIIIYSSVVLLIGNRIDSIAIFKSVGATKGQMNTLLFFEILVYAFVGNGIGLVVSNLFLNLLTKILNIEGLELTTKSIYYIYSFGFGVLLVILSGVSQIIRTTKKSLRELLVGVSSNYRLLNKKILAVLFGVFVISYVVMFYIEIEYILYYNAYLFLLTCILIIYILPYAIRWIYKMLEKIFNDDKASGLIKIVSRQNNRNKSILNTNRLFIFSLILTMIVFSFVRVLGYEIKRLENAYQGDMHILNIADPTNATYNKVLNIEGITSVNKYLLHKNCMLFGADELDLIALNPSELEKVINVDEFKIKTFDFSDNEILMPEGLFIRNNLKIGDEVSITIGRDEIVFIIKDTFDSPLMYFIADMDFLNSNYDIDYNSLVLVYDEALAENAYEALILEFSDKSYIFLTPEDISSHYIGMLTSFIRLFNAFLILVILIVLIGLINNLIIAFQERRSEFNILWQNGLSKSQFLSLVSLESTINGGGVICLGVIFTFLLIRVVILITKPLGVFFAIREKVSSYLIIFLGGFLIYLMINFFIAYFYDYKTRKTRFIKLFNFFKK